MHTNNLNMDNLVSDETISNLDGTNGFTIIELSIGTWDGKRSDKRINDQVQNTSGVKTSKKIGDYKKFLLPDCEAHTEIISYAGQVRTRNYLMTVPWSDNGRRMMSNELLDTYVPEVEASEREFWDMVNHFVDNQYETEVNKAAFTLGPLFLREDYPTKEQLRAKYKFSFSPEPMPAVGDFRIDAMNRGREQLIKMFERNANARLQNAMRDVWERFHDVLLNMSTKLADKEDGTHQIWRDSLLRNPLELVDLLQYLNITKDPKLDELATDLRRVLMGTDNKELRKDDDHRREVKSKIDSLLTKFDF